MQPDTPPRALDLVADLAALAVLSILPMVLLKHLVLGLVMGVIVLAILRLRTEPNTLGWRLLLVTTAFVFALWTLR
jgi:hypothetical protein